MTGTHIKFYLVETELTKENSIVKVLENELEGTKQVVNDILKQGREYIKESADAETVSEIVREVYGSLIASFDNLSAIMDILNVKTLDEYDAFCKDLIARDCCAINTIQEMTCYVLADEIFGDDKSGVKCLNLDDVSFIVGSIREAVENPSESLKMGNKWVKANPFELLTTINILDTIIQAMKMRGSQGVKSYLLCMPQH